MPSRSNVITLIYVGVGTFLVNLFWWTSMHGQALSAQGMAATCLGVPLDVADVAVAGLIILLGVLAVRLGGDFAIILIAGTLGVFFTLTLCQGHLLTYLTLAAILFSMGVYGMVASRNAVRVLMSIELMLNAVMINLVTFSRYVADPVMVRGQVFAIFILTVAAAEAAVGLAIVLAVYRNMSTVDMEKFSLLKW